MTKKQKQFVTKKLIPFILREGGRGFEMRCWRDIYRDESEGMAEGTFYHECGRIVIIPSCGTVCCIGGSIEVLKRRPNQALNFEAAGALIGLNHNQSNVLFSEEIKWPEPFAYKFRAAKTPLTRANVAAALLKEVERTNGAILGEEE